MIRRPLPAGDVIPIKIGLPDVAASLAAMIFHGIITGLK